MGRRREFASDYVTPSPGLRLHRRAAYHNACRSGGKRAGTSDPRTPKARELPGADAARAAWPTGLPKCAQLELRQMPSDTGVSVGGGRRDASNRKKLAFVLNEPKMNQKAGKAETPKSRKAHPAGRITVPLAINPQEEQPCRIS